MQSTNAQKSSCGRFSHCSALAASAPFGRRDPRGGIRVDANVGGEREMDERDDTKTRRFAFDDRGHRAQRKTVDQHARTVSNVGEHLGGMF